MKEKEEEEAKKEENIEPARRDWQIAHRHMFISISLKIVHGCIGGIGGTARAREGDHRFSVKLLEWLILERVLDDEWLLHGPGSTLLGGPC